MEVENDKVEFLDDALPMLSVGDSQKINAGITSVEPDIPPLVGGGFEGDRTPEERSLLQPKIQ